MIEKILYDFLTECLTVPVYLEKRETSGRFVVIEKTGSANTNRLDSATFAMQSYGDSMYEAAALNEQLKDVMQDALTLDEIASVNLNSDYNFTDTTTKKYRYQAVYDLTYYRS